MVNQQSLAKIGVFILLGVNVAAYYVFWPEYQGHPPSNEASAPKQPNPNDQTLPAPNLAKPQEIAPGLFDGAALATIPNPPAKIDDEEAIRKLLEQIKQQEKSVKDNEPTREPRGPRPLAFLKADPLANEEKNAANADVAVTSALTVKLPTSPWHLSIDASGTQTLLVAKLRQADAAGFQVLCDRVEKAAADGSVQAFGNVTFVGAGMKGSCQRLTVSGLVPQVVFEEQVQIVGGSFAAGSHLHGDRIVWELPARNPANRAILGGPK